MKNAIRTTGRTPADPINTQPREDVMVNRQANASGSQPFRRLWALGAAAALVWCGLSVPALAGDPHQMRFASPEDAAEALVAAERGAHYGRSIEKILGPAARKLIFSGDRVADRDEHARTIRLRL